MINLMKREKRGVRREIVKGRFNSLLSSHFSHFSHNGQAMTEMIFILPLFLFLTGGAMAVTYMCWQGIKVQQAANLAARIEGQERVAGGPGVTDIQQVNGLYPGVGDADPTDPANRALIMKNPSSALNALTKARPPDVAGQPSVYGKYYDVIRGMFSSGENQKLYVPPPNIGVNTDQVKVVRVMAPPSIFGRQLPSLTLEGDAYGGEDPHMYSLPRWGHFGSPTSNNSNQLFWQGPTVLHGNLSNPNDD
jgi:hypothetical protein